MSAPDLTALLKKAACRPVLVDVGSANSRHKIWDRIGEEAVVLGFDPDQRKVDATFQKVFPNALFVPRAVTPRADEDELEFILTRYPSCSSVLEPDLEAVSSFAFRDLFQPERRVKVPAITLDQAIEQQGLAGIDWLKLDAQGLDLALIRSLSQANQDKLLAIEIEPGFIHAYKGESLFPECHGWMLENGFWLADLNMQRFPKIRPETQARLAKSHGINPSPFARQIPGAPTAAEATYLREISWFEARTPSRETLAKAFVFSALTGQIGHAFDLSLLYETRHGMDDLGQLMRELANAPFARLRRHPGERILTLADRVKRRIRKIA
ncbi:MAG: FkbM family methyltransferase [Alphaproteobacteria bacterium]|nr:FkbM family methyltransferase [Alphaproteobacteria bacterium]